MVPTKEQATMMMGKDAQLSGFQYAGTSTHTREPSLWPVMVVSGLARPCKQT
jgi:hypothetical protein